MERVIEALKSLGFVLHVSNTVYDNGTPFSTVLHFRREGGMEVAVSEKNEQVGVYRRSQHGQDILLAPNSICYHEVDVLYSLIIDFKATYERN